MCVFCQQVAGSAGLHDASTSNLDFKIRNCAADLNDTQLLSRLYTDVDAIRMKYHTTCLAKIYKRAEQVRKKKSEDTQTDERCLHGIAFTELVEYIESHRDSSECAPVFKMADLAKLLKIV